MNLSSKLSKHFVAMGAVAAAFVGAQANAAIVHSGIVNINVPSTTAGIYLNVVTGISATTPAGAAGWDINPWSSSTLQVWANNAASPNDGVIVGLGSSTTLTDNLTVGTIIDGSGVFGRSSNSETTGATAWILNSSDNIIGFRFLNEVSGQINFGWARFSLAGTAGAQPRTLVEYAYEDSGSAIAAGAVPAPASAALLGLGGLVAARRRRN